MASKDNGKGKEGLAITYMALSQVEAWPKNPKLHSPAIAVSIERFGFNDPVAVNTHPEAKWLLEGHGRIEALRRMHDEGQAAPANILVADEWMVPVVTLRLPPGEAEAYALAHNQLTTAGGWADDGLASVMADLREWNVDLSCLGWSDKELAELLKPLEIEPTGQDPGAQAGRAEELREKWGVEGGDLWECGEHRVVCGDCTDPEVVERVMDGGKAVLLFTDPPYGVSYADKNAFLNSMDEGNRVQTEIEGDHQTPEQMQAFWTLAFGAIRKAVAPGACYYVTGPQGGDLLLLLLLSLRTAGFPLRHMLIWAKNNHVLGRCDYNYKHEPILYGWVDGGHKFYGGFDTSLWEIDRPQKSEFHPTMKPVALYERGIGHSSQEGEVVLDPFLGSGTCLIACERLGRRCRGIELSPAYVAVCLERWHQETGKQPQLLA